MAVVTGATSFIGTHLISALVSAGYCVYGIVRPGSKNNSRIPSFAKLEIINLPIESMARLPKQVPRADVFLHIAWAGTRPPDRDNKVIQQQNIVATLDAFHAAVQLGCHTFLGAGSQAEYGGYNWSIDESIICKPTSEYGKAKLAAFQQICEVAKYTGCRVLWPRIFSVYGPLDYSGSLIMSSLRKMLKDEPIALSPCTHFWDYLFVSDAAKALVALCNTPQANGVYHVASGVHRPLREFLMEMKKITASNSKLDFGAIPYTKGTPVNLQPVIDKMCSETNWAPTVSFRDGIIETVRKL